jgi:predicted secreted protein
MKLKLEEKFEFKYMRKCYRKIKDENFDQKSYVSVAKRHEFIGQVLEDEQARAVRVGMIIHSATHAWISKSLIE